MNSQPIPLIECEWIEKKGAAKAAASDGIPYDMPPTKTSLRLLMRSPEKVTLL